jgi:hypothetical protein
MQRANLLNVGRQGSLDSRVVSKVERFDLASHATLVHHLRLAGDPLVSVSADRYQDHLMEPGPGILQELQHCLLA